MTWTEAASVRFTSAGSDLARSAEDDLKPSMRPLGMSGVAVYPSGGSTAAAGRAVASNRTIPLTTVSNDRRWVLTGWHPPGLGRIDVRGRAGRETGSARRV